MKWWRQGIQSSVMFILGKFLLFQMIRMLHNTIDIIYISSAHIIGPHRPFLSPGIKCLNIFWIVVFNETWNIFIGLGRTFTIPTCNVAPLVNTVSCGLSVCLTIQSTNHIIGTQSVLFWCDPILRTITIGFIRVANTTISADGLACFVAEAFTYFAFGRYKRTQIFRYFPILECIVL